LIRGVLHGDRITCAWHGGMLPSAGWRGWC
jgi:hypothetical protein